MAASKVSSFRSCTACTVSACCQIPEAAQAAQAEVQVTTVASKVRWTRCPNRSKASHWSRHITKLRYIIYTLLDWTKKNPRAHVFDYCNSWKWPLQSAKWQQKKHIEMTININILISKSKHQWAIDSPSRKRWWQRCSQLHRLLETCFQCFPANL